MNTIEKPLPHYILDQKPFWEYCKKHELRMQKCPDCGFIRYPSSIICPDCHSLKEAEWTKLSGKGKVFSFVVFDYVYHAAFAGDIPYAVGSIELEEGPRMLATIIGCKPEDVKVEMPVEVVFEDINEEFALPKFRPIT